MIQKNEIKFNYMKYGDQNTWSRRQTKKHGKSISPARAKYFDGKKWIKNKERKIEKDKKRKQKQIEKIKRRNNLSKGRNL